MANFQESSRRESKSVRTPSPSLDIETRDILIGLRDKGVDYLKFPEEDYEILFIDVDVVGKIVGIQNIPTIGAQLVSVAPVNGQGKARKFEVEIDIQLQQGQAVRMQGLAAIMLEVADLTSGLTPQRGQELLAMLNDEQPVVAHSIESNGQAIYNNPAAKEVVLTLRSGARASKDHWAKLLEEVQ